MTPFMIRICELVGVPASGIEAETRRSEPLPVGLGADRYVIVRSLAEQLVCEANSLLPDEARLSLTDDVTEGQLSFTLACGHVRARVSTAFAGGRALAELRRDGRTEPEAVELADADAVPDLILSVLAQASPDRRLPQR